MLKDVGKGLKEVRWEKRARNGVKQIFERIYVFDYTLMESIRRRYPSHVLRG